MSDTITIQSRNSWLSHCPAQEVNQKSFIKIQNLEEKYVDIVFDSFLSPSTQMNKTKFPSIKHRLAPSTRDQHQVCCIKTCSIF